MDYRFEISKPDSNDFRCEIAINGEQTFSSCTINWWKH